MSLSPDSLGRKELWDCLIKEVNFALFREGEKGIAVRRPTKEENEKNYKNFDDFVVCSSCNGVYKEKALNRHAKRCPGRVKKNNKVIDFTP
ncbi:hypothetical protein JTB14_001571 [Gonioctena quinquepunctata]|nr:hypothetical protein JTB14_001571 [Gonioctena quinquepunctata]